MSNGTTGTAASSLPATGGTSSAGLADWAAPYITNYLGKAQALGDMPYQAYQGPLTAGQSALQTKAFEGIGSLTVPNQGQYTPVGGSFTNVGAPQIGGTQTTDASSSIAQQYMNPYLQSVLNPQIAELNRQAQINQMTQAAKFAGAGAFGGSRQGLVEAENQRNLLGQIAKTTGEGYASAYDKAVQQFNEEQRRKIQEAQFGADFGLKGLEAQKGIYDQMLKGGEIERGITSEGIKADLDEFNRQREFPYKQVQFQRDMISGLPISSVTNTPAQLSGAAQFITAMGGIDKLLKDTGQSDLNSLLKNLFGGNLFGGSGAES